MKGPAQQQRPGVASALEFQERARAGKIADISTSEGTNRLPIGLARCPARLGELQFNVVGRR